MTEQLLPRIPSVPIGYGPATELLRRLDGPTSHLFTGALNFSYGMGPSVFKLRLWVEHKFKRTPMQNVIAVLHGVEDRSIILCNHRDAWVYGASYPASGTAALLELARGLGKLKEAGWRPLRSILLCSWSGEEYSHREHCLGGAQL